MYYSVSTTCYHCWWPFGNHRWTRTCQLVCLVLTSRKMVLCVPRPWYRRCCRHSWQAVLWHTLHRDRMECRHPSYSMWAHNPQFHRIETWLLSPTLWCSVRYQTQCLCLMLWAPFHHPLTTSNACLSIWNFSYLPLFHSMCFPEFKLGRYFVPHSLGQPRLINRVPIRPLLSFPSYPIHRYDAVPERRMTTHRDTPMQTNKDINEKD